MFHYDESGKPDGLRMVDFQLSRVGHPLNDLLYFLYSSATPEMRKEQMIDLLRFYFDTVKRDLELLNVELNYTFDDFLQDYKKRSTQWLLGGGM